MRAVVQRVSGASVKVDGRTVGGIGKGLVVFGGIQKGDTPVDVEYVAKKVSSLRIFEDADGKMNLDCVKACGEVLVVSQFTLLGDARRGSRPSFSMAEEPERAEELFMLLVNEIRKRSLSVSTGIFRRHMEVELTNDGPVTILIDSRKTF